MPSIAVAISSTARPASSEVSAICWEATPSRVAEPDSRPTSERSWPAMVAKAVPKTSRSERGVGCDGEVAAGDAPGGVGGLAQIGDHALEGLGERADLVAAAHVEVLLEVALGDRVGGDDHAARPSASWR